MYVIQALKNRHSFETEKIVHKKLTKKNRIKKITTPTKLLVMLVTPLHTRAWKRGRRSSMLA